MNTRNQLLAVLLASSVLMPAGAWAQQAAGRQSSADAAPGGIETVVVTAQKRSESEVNVPISIAAVSADTLERSGVSDVASLQRLVPGFSMAFAGANAQPTIRGVGSQVAGAGLPSNVATYVDGFYKPNSVTTNMEFVDVSSIEVLKGPQGSLYGRNATGGAVLINTKAPSFEPESLVKLSYGSFNDMKAAVFATGPLTDTLAASVSLYGQHSDGYTKNVVTGKIDGDRTLAGARVKLLYQPNDDMRFTLTFEHSHINDPNYFILSDYKGEAVAALIPGAIITDRPHHNSNDFENKFRSNGTGIFLRSEFTLPWAVLTSSTGAEWQKDYRAYDVDGSSLPIQHAEFPGKQQTFSQQVDLTSNTDGPVQWLAGFFLYHDDSFQLPLTIVSSTPPIAFVGGRVMTNSAAVFGDITYNILPRLFITGGLRYSYDHLNENFSAFPDYIRTSASTSFDALTPRAVVRYELTENSNIYASFNQGYKTGGYNVNGASTEAVRPEKISAYEVGYKIAGQGWRLDTAAFYYDYKDLQVNAYQGPVTSLVNAAKARIYGGDLRVSGDLTESLKLDVGLSYVNGKYVSFPGAPHYTWSPITGITVASGDASGNPVVNSPEFSGNIGLTYVRPLEEGYLELSGNYSYQTTTYYDAFGETRQPAYGVLNLRAAWTAPDDAWTVGAFVRNATDQNYVRTIFQQPVAFSALYAPPVNFGVDLTLRGAVWPFR